MKRILFYSRMAITTAVIALATAAFFAKPEIEKSADGIPLLGVGFPAGKEPLAAAQIRHALESLSDRLNEVERRTQRTSMVERILQSRRTTGLILLASGVTILFQFAEFAWDRKKEQDAARTQSEANKPLPAAVDAPTDQ